MAYLHSGSGARRMLGEGTVEVEKRRYVQLNLPRYLRKSFWTCHIDVTDAEKPLIDAANCLKRKPSQEVLKENIRRGIVLQEAAGGSVGYDQTFEEVFMEQYDG